MNEMRVLSNRAHCGHQWELWKLPIEVDIIQDSSDHRSKWDYTIRPFPENARYLKTEDINVKEYDLCIAHFDENFMSPRHPAINGNYGAQFRWLIDNASEHIPTIAVCHGIPQYEESGTDLDTEDMHIYGLRRKNAVDYLSHVTVVCNSYGAQNLWKFKKSKVIWHGFDFLEFYNGTHNKSILAMRKDALKGRPHMRGYYFHQKVMKYLPKRFTLNHTRVVDPSKYSAGTNEFATERFRRYRESLSDHRVFLNTTVHSPMPRCRGEAMMCGLVSVNYESHDVDLFIDNGVNGFYSKDPEEIADHLIYLDKNPDVALKMGMKSRGVALKEFDTKRYLHEWMDTIRSVL